MKVLLIALIFFVAACAHEEDKSALGAQRKKENDRLLALFSPLQGTYAGELVNPQDPGDTKEVKLFVSISQVVNGFDENGRPKLVVTPVVRFRNESVVEGDKYLRADYLAETGELLLTDKDGGNAGKPVFSIRGRLLKGKMTRGEVFEGGLIGYLSLSRIGSVPQAPFRGREIETRERLYEIYEPVTGRYLGRVVKSGKVKREFELHLFVREVAIGTSDTDGGPTYRPQLWARYRLLKFNGNPVADPDYNFQVQYFPNRLKQELVMADGSPVVYKMGLLVMGDEIRDIRAYVRFKDDKIGIANTELVAGEFATDTGPEGTVTADRKGEAEPISDGTDAEYRRRTLQLMKSLAGVYKGTLKRPPGSREKDAPVTLSLEVGARASNMDGTVSPTLIGYYVRNDFSPGVGTYLLFGNYYPSTREIELATSGPDGSGTVRGAGFFSMSGKITGNKMHNMRVISHKGFVGTFEGTRQ